MPKNKHNTAKKVGGNKQVHDKQPIVKDVVHDEGCNELPGDTIVCSINKCEIGIPRITETSPLHYWTDITNEFFDVIPCLKLGELVHDNMFGLFEAMSAIEIMDPKMDAGMVCNRSKKTLNFDKAKERGELKVSDLTYKEVINVIDMTMRCLVSWLEGNSLAQTVFTNLYFQKPHAIENRPLKVFFMTIYKVIDIVREIITRAGVFEEEDFQPNNFGYHLDPNVTDSKLSDMLRDVETELNEIIRFNVKSQDDTLDAIGLNFRLRFIKILYLLLCTLGRANGNYAERMGECHNMLNVSCNEVIPIITKSFIPGQEYNPKDVMGYEPMVNKRLLPPTFPRHTQIKTNEECYKYFSQLLLRLKHVCRITTCTSFHDALNYFMQLSSGNSCIVSRSLMQLLYMPPKLYLQIPKIFGVTNLTDVLRDAAKEFVAPPSLTQKIPLSVNNVAVKDCVDAFLIRCVRPFMCLIQMCGHNRARQRDKLATLLEEFAPLQEEAEKLDAYLHGILLRNDPARSHLTCYSTWILYYILRIMIMYVLSGFELELYSPHEYAYIYWYLNEFLYSWLASCLNRAAGMANSKVPEKSRKKNKNKKKPVNNEEPFYQTLQVLSNTYYKAMVAFSIDKKLKSPFPEYDNERVRYEHRFAAFGILNTPPLMQYLEYREMTNRVRLNSSTSLYIASAKQFRQVKIALESVQNLNEEGVNLLKVVKNNFVVLKLLASGHKTGPADPLSFDFTTHPCYPMFKLSSQKPIGF